MMSRESGPFGGVRAGCESLIPRAMIRAGHSDVSPDGRIPGDGSMAVSRRLESPRWVPPQARRRAAALSGRA